MGADVSVATSDLLEVVCAEVSGVVIVTEVVALLTRGGKAITAL